MNNQQNKHVPTLKTGLLWLSLALLSACASTSGHYRKVVIDNSAGGGTLPDWATDQRTSWEKEDTVYFRVHYSAKGSQRLNGCYDLAKLEMSETVLENIRQEIRGEIALANEGIAEDSEPLITKSVTKSMEGTITGLKTTGQAFERYAIGDTERLDCYVLAEMKRVDYKNMLNHSLDRLISVSADVANAMRKKQANFFKNGDTSMRPIEPTDTGRDQQ